MRSENFTAGAVVLRKFFSWREVNDEKPTSRPCCNCQSPDSFHPKPPASDSRRRSGGRIPFSGLLEILRRWCSRASARMLPSIQLESPRHLIKLPQPLDSINGRYHVADILNGPVGSQKRKRIELAVAVDGEGLHLYKVGPHVLSQPELQPTDEAQYRSNLQSSSLPMHSRRHPPSPALQLLGGQDWEHHRSGAPTPRLSVRRLVLSVSSRPHFRQGHLRPTRRRCCP